MAFGKRPFGLSGFWDQKHLQAMSELYLKLGAMPEFMTEYDALRTSDCNKNNSNYARLALIMKKHLQNSVTMHSMHDASFSMASLVAQQQAEYDKSLCQCFNNLLLAVAKHMLAQTPAPKAPPAGPKVIKHHTKPSKVLKDLHPKAIGITHVRTLFNYASARHSYNAMRRAGVAEDIAIKASGGPLVDIAETHAASDAIWGPVV